MLSRLNVNQTATRDAAGPLLTDRVQYAGTARTATASTARSSGAASQSPHSPALKVDHWKPQYIAEETYTVAAAEDNANQQHDGVYSGVDAPERVPSAGTHGTRRTGFHTGAVPRQTGNVLRVTRYGYASTKYATHALPFGNTRRDIPINVPEGARVPFHYYPPPYYVPEQNSDLRKSTMVIFGKATARQGLIDGELASKDAVMHDDGSGDNALSYRKGRHPVIFPRAGRDGRVPPPTPGPADYQHVTTEAYRPLSFAKSSRDNWLPDGGPPLHDVRYAWEATRAKHSFTYRFSTQSRLPEATASTATGANMSVGARPPRIPTKNVYMSKAKRF